MLVAAAVCPHPPLLIPELCGGDASDLDELRAACLAAVGRLQGALVEEVVVVGADPTGRSYDAAAGGSFRSYGCSVHVGAAGSDLPLSLAVGAWLLDRCRQESRRYQGVRPASTPDVCKRLGSQLAAGSGRVGLLVMGDGSARRTSASPGPYDARATPYDAEVAAALAAVDPGRLLDLEVALAAELMVAGRAAWQVLAGAALAARSPEPGAEVPADSAVGQFAGELSYDQAPYGVGYLVGTWEALVRG